MKTTNKTVWMSSEETLITGDVTAQGFLDCGCGDVFLQNPITKDYIEPIYAIRVHKTAVDGACKPVKFTSIAAAHEYLKNEGLLETGVSNDGIVRFDGCTYRYGHSKTWFSSPVVDKAVRSGKV